MRQLAVLSLIIFSSIKFSFAQINAYARVTNITGSVLTLSNANETFDTFEDGEWIVIMQMQDNVLGNTSSNVNFGNATGTLLSAGLYETAQILSHTESAGLPATITINGALTNTYSTGTNSHVQIISFRSLSTGNFTTTANITAVDWDGNVGGVVALHVGGTLTLSHDITANGAGFRGGAVSANYYSSAESCHTTVWRENDNRQGEKGEGIYRRTDATYRYGRAKILNGGGGGNHVNAGGGGGGNYTTGGRGGPGWNCGGNDVGGRGGILLASTITRVFMGGGGGGGQQNDSQGSAGGDGGGIILIKANRIETTGVCGGRIISANGNSAANATNDGSGGGGAGGSIILDVNSFGIVAGCNLSVQASGGNGGTSVHGDIHGGGGGGGQGTVLYSATQPTTNVTTVTNNGTSGCNNNSNPCNSRPTGATGTNGDGIDDNEGVSALPVVLLNFDAAYHHEQRLVSVRWSTATEINNDRFVLEKSTNGENFYSLFTVKGAGTSTAQHNYSFDDYELSQGHIYYRLRQIDYDSTTTFSRVISVKISEKLLPSCSIYPNPVDQKKHLTLKFYNLPFGTIPEVVILDVNGTAYTAQLQAAGTPGAYTLSTEHLPVGFNLMKIKVGSDTFVKKFVIKAKE